MKLETLFTDAHAVFSLRKRVKHTCAVGQVDGGGSARDTDHDRARCKGNAGLSYFQGHVDGVKPRMIDGHGDQTSSAIPTGGRLDGDGKPLDLARGQHHSHGSAGGPTFRKSAHGEFKGAEVVAVVSNPCGRHTSAVAEVPHTFHTMADGSFRRHPDRNLMLTRT